MRLLSGAMYKIFFHITDAIEIYSNNLENSDSVSQTGNESNVANHSPVLDPFQKSVNLTAALIKNPSSTFFGKVKNDAFCEEGICMDDLLIIDKSIGPADYKMALCFIDGEYIIKRISTDKDGAVWLMPSNESFEPVKISSENEAIIWGIIIHLIRSF